MAYTNINEIILKTDWVAKDITIFNFNQILEDIRIYLEQLYSNIEYVKLVGGGGTGGGGPGVYYTETLPAEEDWYYGLTLFEEE